MFRCRCRLFSLILSMFLAGRAQGVEDFCFIQISDTHIGPLPAGSPPLRGGDRSVSTIGWVCEQAKTPQVLEVGDQTVTTPRPSLVVCTGDLMEFGNVGRTFESFAGLFKPLQIPLYLVPGNHDNTWAGVMQIMRDRYGGDHYSFDRFGCHFIFFDSATPQEPTPSLEQRTLTFLKRDLSQVKPETPVFLFCHHPISSAEFAKPHEQLRFLETIRNHNIVLLVMGHGHSPRAEKWGTLDSVMGGSTFGPNTGYSTIFVQGDTLRVVYRFHEKAASAPADGSHAESAARQGLFKVLLEKSIRSNTAGFAFACRVTQVGAGAESIPVICSVPRGDFREMKAQVDSDPERSAVLSPRVKDRLVGQAPIRNLTPGAHYVHVLARVSDVTVERTMPFDVIARNLIADRITLNAGMKARPVALGDGLLVATTAGEMVRLEGVPRQTEVNHVASMKSGVLSDAGAEILHEPALADKYLYVASGNGKVSCLTLDGKAEWTCDVGASTYGTPAVDQTRVYAADLQGFVHAVERSSGQKLWSRQVSDYPIEQSMLLSGGVLYFGAWDGLVYALSASDGSVKWKTRCPAGQDSPKLANRYYAAADASPIIIGDCLFFADRAYHLGAYTLDGQYAGGIATGISAIGLSQDGKFFYARGLESGLTKYDGKGQKIWNNPVALGRFPIPPTEHAGKVYVCSNRGLLSAVDAATGQTLWQYQTTPQLHVMAPVGIDPTGRPCVAGMDGSVTCVASR